MATKETSTRQILADKISKCKGSIAALQKAFQECGDLEVDKKSTCEQSFRDVLKDLIINVDKSTMQPFAELVLLAVQAAELGICFHSVPFLLLSDAFDCLTLDVCEKLFDTVEGNVAIWSKPMFFSSGKTQLLRMCNDLLRRLSSSQNTVFCGRIQLLLAHLFPLSEKSGLNLMSHFNIENVTTYNKTITPSTTDSSRQAQAISDDGEDMEIEQNADDSDKLASERPVDYNLYQKLWLLQDFFRLPTQCFAPDKWKVFTTNIQAVLQTFSSYKLEGEQTKKLSTSTQSDKASQSSKNHGDEPPSKKRREEPTDSEEPMEVGQTSFPNEHYFAKYLTSEKLVNLQLSDSHFRRHILIQVLIIFQYLTGDVKFKSHSQNLSDAQALWIDDTTKKVYKLIEETPPDGKGFANYIRHVLKREENWIKWKNEGCHSFEKPVPPSPPPTPPKPRLGDKILNYHKEKDVGNAELSRLWNLCPDNLEACSSIERKFIPPLDIFFEEAAEQAKDDSEDKIPKDDKILSNPNFCWQSLRLLARESPHFFQFANQSQIRPLDEYLESVIVSTVKDFKSTND